MRWKLPPSGLLHTLFRRNFLTVCKNLLKNILNRLLEFLDRLSAAFFRGGQDKLSVWLNRVWLAFLYLGGLLHWAYFWSWGKLPLKLHDWPQEAAYFYFLRQAALRNQLPLQIGSTLVTTDRYIARPDTLLSPQAYLLRFMQPGPFMLVNTLILFTVGCLGLLLLRRRYHLAPAAFGALFLLFNFNGNITAHLAVGHAEWVGYFLLPFFVLLVLKLVEGEKVGWGWVLGVAATLLGIFLQGAFHFFLWCLIFLAGLGIFYPKYLLPVVKAILFSALLSLVRILPPAVEFFNSGPSFISGFPSVTDMLSSLVVLYNPSNTQWFISEELGIWEVDTFIGFIGAALLVYFGIYQTWRRGGRLTALFAPVLLLAFLSIGYIYKIFNWASLPLLSSERITSRFLILPVVFLAVLGCIQLQQLFHERLEAGWRERLFYLALLALLGHDLLQHSRIWRVENMKMVFTSMHVNLNTQVIYHPDPAYFTALGLGLAASGLTLAFLVWKIINERKKAQAT
jgi:hypothetical protein